MYVLVNANAWIRPLCYIISAASCKKQFAPTGARTLDIGIKSPTLYRLRFKLARFAVSGIISVPELSGPDNVGRKTCLMHAIYVPSAFSLHGAKAAASENCTPTGCFSLPPKKSINTFWRRRYTIRQHTTASKMVRTI